MKRNKVPFLFSVNIPAFGKKSHLGFNTFKFQNTSINIMVREIQEEIIIFNHGSQECLHTGNRI